MYSIKMYNTWLFDFTILGFLLVNNLFFKKACFLFEIKHSPKLKNTFSDLF